MPNQSSTSLCWNCLWMMSILYNDGLEAGAEHVAVSIYRLNCTRLLLFLLHKTSRGYNQNNNHLKQRTEHAAESNSSCSHLGNQKCNYFYTGVQLQKEAILHFTNYIGNSIDCPSFYVLFHVPSIHYQETTKIKEIGN